VTPGGGDAENLRALPNTKVIDLDVGSRTGSDAHGYALNSFLEHINTEYAIFADPDTAVVCRNWDEVCLSALKPQEMIAAIGTPYGPLAVNRFRHFPNVVFMAFHVDTLRKLKPNFLPEAMFWRKLKHHLEKFGVLRGRFDGDVGWQIPRLYEKAGIKGLCFEYKDFRDPTTLLFGPRDFGGVSGEVRGEEYQWQGTPIVSHQTRSRMFAYDGDPISSRWLDRVCAYAGISRTTAAGFARK